MKTDKISFGQTFLHKSYFKYLTPETQNKLAYSYGLGELFPIDLGLGATKKGNLNVTISACNPWDHLIINNGVPLTPENIYLYSFVKNVEHISGVLHGTKYPYRTYEIKNIQSMTQEDIAFAIREKISEYYENFSKYFCN